MHDELPVADLVRRARRGDKTAWDSIVTRYAALVWSVCRRHGLTGADADDVGGGVWLLLVEHLDGIRDPAALPGWLATTTRNECLRLLRSKKRYLPVDDPDLSDDAGPASDEHLLVAERHDALRAAFAGLQERCQRLLAMLFGDPPVPYAEVSSTLGMPIGAIGPNRRRCLERLRRSSELVAFGHPVER